MSLAEYLSAVSQGHPELRAMAARGGQYEASLQKAEGAYDSTLIHKSAARLSGYYDGIYARQRYVQPIETFNAQFFTEYRISDQDFPVYEQENQTLSGGEASVGVRLSLLQNRDIDDNRFGIRQASVDTQKWRQQVRIAQSEFYFEAIQAYLNWAEAKNYQAAAQQLVETTRAQQNAIQQRVDSGDLADLALTEFATRLLERELSLLEAEGKVQTSLQKLSYFMGGWKGNFYQSQSSLFTEQSRGWQTLFALAEQTRKDINTHPAVATKLLELSVYQQKLRLADTKLLPKLDLEAAIAKDFGAGPAPLEQAETKIGLYFSLPLQRNQAKAEKSKVQLELQQLNAELDALKQAITTQLEEARVNLNYATRLFEMNHQQVSLNNRLLLQEQRQFELGASDFFMLNSREVDAFKAKLKSIRAEFNIYRQQLRILKIQASLDHEFVVSTAATQTWGNEVIIQRTPQL
ncbi:TolC family protein [Alteromonas aestuariivivens]|nr:TolC family protein [Alteromonas aestuariivivens]